MFNIKLIESLNIKSNDTLPLIVNISVYRDRFIVR